KRIRLLPARSRRAPNADAFLLRPRPQHRRHNGVAEMIERQLVAEEQRFVGRHGLDHTHDQAFVPAVAQLLDQRGKPNDSGATRHRQKPALRQILFVVAEDEPGPLLEEPAQIFIIVRRHWRSPQNRRVILPAIRSSGSTAEQIPACTAEPGIPQMTLVASSWAITLPPLATISAAPRAPSLPMPVRMSARFQPPHTFAAEEKSGSTAGLQKLTGGPLSISATAVPSRRATRMCLPPGAT